MVENPPQRGVARQHALGMLAVLVAGTCLPAHESPTAIPAQVTYTKVLEGSTPEYLSITVNASGEALYDGRKLDDPPAPRPLKLTEPTTRRIFQLAAALGYFDSVDLESHKKVANLGRKSFTYEAGGKRHQAEFNYTMRRDAQELTDVFERIASVAQHIATLEYSIKYDHLSLPKQLRQIQSDLDRHALADPELMAPMLEKIVRNPRFLHLAQSRAQDILQRLQHSN
jgi:hypothetical protein